MTITAHNRRVRTNRSNPFATNQTNSVKFTIGTEATNAITVTVQAKDGGYNNVPNRVALKAWLASASTGVGRRTVGPNGGIAIGSYGELNPKTGSDALLLKGTLAIHSTPEQFKTTATAYFKIGNVQYTKTAATGLTFTAGHVVTASKFGIILVQVNAAGTVSTKVPAATQAYNTAVLARAALPAPDAGKVALGYIAIANNAGDWTANTDDLTDGSDLTTATFVDGTEEATYPKEFELVTDATGKATVVLTETGVPPAFYLAVQLPNGKVQVSDAITFA